LDVFKLIFCYLMVFSGVLIFVGIKIRGFRMFDFTITVENVVVTGLFSECVDLGVACLKLEGSKCNWNKFRQCPN
jgi:hypothetical protein